MCYIHLFSGRGEVGLGAVGEPKINRMSVSERKEGIRSDSLCYMPVDF